MYKNIICFFSFPFITWNVWIGRMRERERVEDGWVCARVRMRAHTHTGGKVWIYDETSAFSSFSTFTRLVQGHLKASNHLSFSSLLNPGQSGTRPEIRAMLCLVAAFPGLLFSAHLCWLYNIPDTHTNSRGHISSLPSMCYMWTYLLLASYPHNLHSTSAGQYLRPVYFRKQVYFLFIFCSSTTSF